MNSAKFVYDDSINNMNTANQVNILIVDDDKDILHAIRDILELEELPCLITISNTASEAMEIALKNPPDIAILDIKIGNDNGLTLVPELKKLNPDVSCIMITAYRETEYAITAIRFGAHDFIYKPVEPIKLIKTIENLVDNKRLQKETQKFERRFETIFRQSQQWIFVLSSNGLLINVNQAALDAIGTITDTIENTYIWDTPWFSSSTTAQQFIKASIDSKKHTTGLKETELIIDGLHGFFELSYTPILNKQGLIDQILFECRDITRRKEYEEKLNRFNNELELKVKERTIELKQSITLLEHEIENRKKVEIELIQQKEKAEEASKAKSEFLSRMSHELRTPMNAILGFGQLLELDAETHFTDEQKSNINEIMSAGHHLLTMINDILELSKLDKGEYNLQLEAINIRDIFRSSISSVQEDRQYNNCTIHNNISDELILADSNAMKQVTEQIIANSIMYNKGDGDITVDSQQTEQNQLKISIKDSGPGITDELRDNLFTPFDRLSTTMFETEGSGIGLAVAQNLMQLMNGKIGVESKPGEGTCFWLELPLA